MVFVPVSEGVISGKTCIYIQNTCIYILYMHIHAYTYIDLGRTYIHAYMCKYMHVHVYTYIYVHIHTYTDISESLSGGVFEGGQPTPSGLLMDANLLDLL